ncbi:MAG TPA: M48 family metalloprotease [Salinarimonas sp.]|nr:M48 family metalloprotease [Salinarimonas sp.]
MAVYFLLVLLSLVVLVLWAWLAWPYVFSTAIPYLQLLLGAAYFAGMGVCLLVVIFLLKPLVAQGTAREEADRSLDPEKDARLFQMVNAVADRLEAPRPVRIDVDLNANASAYQAGGWLGALGRSQPVLRLGLPLLATMTTRQVAGMIAHELGHFAQSGGGRLQALIRRINRFFYGLVFGRDAWDEALARATEEWGPLGLIPLLGRVLIWCLRWSLWPLFAGSHLVSLQLERQQEFDADRCMAMIAGSDGTTDFFQRLSLVSVATDLAYERMIEAWKREGRLPDDYMALVMATIEDLPPRLQATVKKHMEAKKTSIWDSHPAAMERIRRIEELEEPGLYRTEADSRKLLGDFHALSRELTRQLHEANLGSRNIDEFIHSADAVVREQRRTFATYDAIGGYFQGVFNNPYFPLLMQDEWLREPEDPAALVEDVQAVRHRLLTSEHEITEARKRFFESSKKIFLYEASIALLRADLIPPLDLFKPDKPSRPAAERRLRACHLIRNEARQTLEKYKEDAQRRLVASLRLLHREEVRDRLPADAPTVEQVQQTLRDFSSVCFVLDLVATLRSHATILELLLASHQDSAENRSWQLRVQEYLQQCNRYLALIIEPLKPVPYPFEHAAGPMSVADYILPQMPHPFDLKGVFQSCERVVEATNLLYFRLLGQLVTAAQQVEEAVGLAKLPVPEVIEDEADVRTEERDVVAVTV